MPSNQRISINLTPEEHRELAALAEKARVSKAWLGRRAISELLERYRQSGFLPPLSSTSVDVRNSSDESRL